MRNSIVKATFIFLGIVAVSCVIWILATRDQSDPTKVLTDRDTGASILLGSTGAKLDIESPVILFGIKNLTDKQIPKEVIDGIIASLRNYSSQNLKEKYTSLTIRPQDLIIKDGSLKTTLRLGQTDILLPFEITYNDNYAFKMFIEDTSGENGGNVLKLSGIPFNGSLYKIESNSASPTSIDSPITLITNAGDGYRSQVPSKIRDLGHNPSDFIFEFTNFKDKFAI